MNEKCDVSMNSQFFISIRCGIAHIGMVTGKSCVRADRCVIFPIDHRLLVTGVSYSQTCLVEEDPRGSGAQASPGYVDTF